MLIIFDDQNTIDIQSSFMKEGRLLLGAVYSAESCGNNEYQKVVDNYWNATTSMI